MTLLNGFNIKWLVILFPLHSLCQSTNPYSDSYNIEPCGTDNNIIRIKDVIMMPDPIVVPGTIILGFNMDVTKTIFEPISLDYTIQRQVDNDWITVSCANKNHSTCSVKDVCQAFDKFPFCRKAVTDDLPCKCPLLEKSYTIDAFPIPLLLDGPVTVGQYKAQIKANNWMYGELMCYNVQLEVASAQHHKT